MNFLATYLSLLQQLRLHTLIATTRVWWRVTPVGLQSSLPVKDSSELFRMYHWHGHDSCSFTILSPSWGAVAELTCPCGVCVVDVH